MTCVYMATTHFRMLTKDRVIVIAALSLLAPVSHVSIAMTLPEPKPTRSECAPDGRRTVGTGSLRRPGSVGKACRRLSALGDVVLMQSNCRRMDRIVRMWLHRCDRQILINAGKRNPRDWTHEEQACGASYS
ncbi:hypothetical protein F01_400067 [Burkholderia cenocepacia]|nr:hypothetical protein F01_400067 [Burkholderia cenocepacia]